MSDYKAYHEIFVEKLKRDEFLFLFAGRLKSLMEEHTVTQKDIAEYVGCSRQAISLYLAGERSPDVTFLCKISAYFGVSADYLLGLTDVKKINITDKAIINATGLSESALDNIRHVSVDSLNLLLQNHKLLYLLEEIYLMLSANETMHKRGYNANLEAFQFDINSTVEEMTNCNYTAIDVEDAVNLYRFNAEKCFSEILDEILEETTKNNGQHNKTE